MGIDRDLRITIGLRGIGDGIMFDRYAGSNNTKLTIEEKLYLSADGQRRVVIPALNIVSYLSATNTRSAPKVLFPAKQYGVIAHAMASFVSVEESELPLLRDGAPIVFSGFDSTGTDASAGIIEHRSVARVAKGVPNPKERPLLLNRPSPWTTEFHLIVLANDEITLDDLRRVFRRGGLSVGLGTYRPYFGKFEVTKFDVAEIVD